MVITPLFLRIRNSQVFAAVAALLLGSFVSVGQAPSQDKVYETDDLARQLANRLSSADKKGVLVIDLASPAGQRQEFGKWLADRVYLSLAKESPAIELIDRTQLYAALRDQLPLGQKMDVKTVNTLGNSTGANTVVLGSYGMVGDDLGITLVAYRVSEGGPPTPPNYMIGMINGKIPLTNEVRDHLIDPLDSLRPKDGIYLPGIGGISMPTCIKCTPPLMHVPDVDVPGILRDKRGAGDVIVNFVLTAEGRVTDPTISNRFGYGVDELYLKAVTDWQFSPATDPNNRPVPVRVNFDVHFNLQLAPQSKAPGSP
jgi:TonB family protein